MRGREAAANSCAHPNCRKENEDSSFKFNNFRKFLVGVYVVTVMYKRVVQEGSWSHTDYYLASEAPSFLLQARWPPPRQ